MSEEERLRRWLSQRAEDDEHEGALLDAKSLYELYEKFLVADPFQQLEIKQQLKLLLSRTGASEK